MSYATHNTHATNKHNKQIMQNKSQNNVIIRQHFSLVIYECSASSWQCIDAAMLFKHGIAQCAQQLSYGGANPCPKMSLFPFFFATKQCTDRLMCPLHCIGCHSNRYCSVPQSMNAAHYYISTTNFDGNDDELYQRWQTSSSSISF